MLPGLSDRAFIQRSGWRIFLTPPTVRFQANRSFEYIFSKHPYHRIHCLAFTFRVFKFSFIYTLLFTSIMTDLYCFSVVGAMLLAQGLFNDTL